MDKNRLRDAARNNIVTIMFIVLCAVCMAFSGYAPNYVLYELYQTHRLQIHHKGLQDLC